MDEWMWRIVCTVVGSLITTAIIGAITYFRHRWLDSIRLKCEIKSNTDSAVLDHFGSPCMELTIKSIGLRSARIKDALLCLEDQKDFVSCFQRGYDKKDCIPVEGEPQTLVFKFFKFSKQNSTDGYILDRDDICRFLLPVCVGGIELFTKAQSEKVTIRIVYFDDIEKIVLKGLIIQNKLRSLLTLAENSNESFQAKTAVVQIRAISYNPPDLSFRGSINTKEIKLE